MFCKNCGSQIDSDSKFCTGCGAQTSNYKPVCPKCGNEASGKFCITCGYSMSGTEGKNSNEKLYLGLGIFGFVLTIVGCFLPFITASILYYSKSFGFIEGDGKIVLILSIIALIFFLLKKGAVSLSLNIYSLYITLYDGINVQNSSFKTPIAEGGLDYGFYVLLIGLILFIVMSALLSSKRGLITSIIVNAVLIAAALITTPIVLGIMNDAKEAANLRSVEAYAKSIEYGVIQYEYKNDGKLPKSYCDVKPYVSNTNTEVVCDIELDGEYANVVIKHCKVGDYEKSSYRYDGTLKTENRGAEKEEVTEFASPERCY